VSRGHSKNPEWWATSSAVRWQSVSAVTRLRPTVSVSYLSRDVCRRRSISAGAYTSRIRSTSSRTSTAGGRRTDISRVPSSITALRTWPPREAIAETIGGLETRSSKRTGSPSDRAVSSSQLGCVSTFSAIASNVAADAVPYSRCSSSPTVTVFSKSILPSMSPRPSIDSKAFSHRMSTSTSSSLISACFRSAAAIAWPTTSPSCAIIRRSCGANASGRSVYTFNTAYTVPSWTIGTAADARKPYSSIADRHGSWRSSVRTSVATCTSPVLNARPVGPLPRSSSESNVIDTSSR